MHSSMNVTLNNHQLKLDSHAHLPENSSMKESIKHKLEALAERFEEVGALLNEASIINDNNRYRELSKEYAQLEPVAQAFQGYQALLQDIADNEALAQEDDPEMRALAQEELQQAGPKQAAIEQALQVLLLPRDPNDDRNVYLEIRAGTGGDEASIFAGDLFRMYSRYAETMGWQVELISGSDGEHGGYKEVIAKINGKEVYAKLKFESGVHRVQRVPETEAQGRIHTSACTVAVLAEADEIGEIDLNPAELRIDTYKASGAGGQHVNKTDSAIRITHIPTGLVVECQEERSQHKNRAKAMALLKTRLYASQQEKIQSDEAQTRRNLVGSGDRSERIRTYNFPQGRLTDHRINLTLYRLLDVMQGDLNPVIEPLVQEYQADQLADLGG